MPIPLVLVNLAPLDQVLPEGQADREAPANVNTQMRKNSQGHIGNACRNKQTIFNTLVVQTKHELNKTSSRIMKTYSFHKYLLNRKEHVDVLTVGPG